MQRTSEHSAEPTTRAPLRLVHAVAGAEWAPYGLTLAILVVGLAAWQFAAGRWIDPLWVSRPTDIGLSLTSMLKSGELGRNLWYTMQEAFYGFWIGGVIGGIMGLAMGRIRFLATALTPFVVAFFTMPRLALAPLFIIWFGVGLKMKVALTASVVYFPVYMATFAGAQEVSEKLVGIVRVMGGGTGYIYRHIVVPSALTWLFVGLKQSVPYSLLGAVVGELIASNKGLGFLLRRAAGDFDTAGVLAVVVVLAMIGLVTHELFRVLEKRMVPWKKSNALATNDVY